MQTLAERLCDSGEFTIRGNAQRAGFPLLAAYAKTREIYPDRRRRRLKDMGIANKQSIRSRHCKSQSAGRVSGIIGNKLQI